VLCQLEVRRKKFWIYRCHPVLSFKLFGWVFCLFRFNGNIETLCFGMEAKQPKQTVSEKTEKN
jgi:hypothetical protein